jgi:hypothetical protein
MSFVRQITSRSRQKLLCWSLTFTIFMTAKTGKDEVTKAHILFNTVQWFRTGILWPYD